ncbi:MAG: TrkH family potassium uptake protein [Eubacteriales bacterium]|nr:TrkH family potassium uptake protein [Eubacteriales bacterium]
MALLKKLTPAQTILIGFFAVIFIGGLLLTLPIASANGSFTEPIDAFFTSVSATCVTGLVTLDTGTYWSVFGKAVILILIQVGGMGVMSMSFMVSIIMKRRVTPRERLIFVQSMNLPDYSKVMRFFKDMMLFTFIFEGAGAILLSLRFIPQFGFWEGLGKSVFHSISAFCNAGFDIFGNFQSLTGYASDSYINLVIALLIIFGGLGFVVWENLYRKARYGETLSPYTKVVLVTTGVLLIGGAVLILVSEWSNAGTIGASSFPQKLQESFFQSVTFRTAGFNTIDQGALTGMSKFIGMILMFIGGSSASTAGGIKTVTFALLFVGVLSIARGRKEITIYGRRVENSALLRALSLAGIALTSIVIGSLLLGLTQSAPFLDVLFETFSAFGTVGLSTGITSTLNVFGKLIIMLLMYFGRVGILTVTYSILIGLNKNKQTIKYPKTNFLIG